jgi:hypothetical protein
MIGLKSAAAPPGAAGLAPPALLALLELEAPLTFIAPRLRAG